eukprot:362507-Chlamydomonas_euryale.AAC.14
MAGWHQASGPTPLILIQLYIWYNHVPMQVLRHLVQRQSTALQFKPSGIERVFHWSINSVEVYRPRSTNANEHGLALRSLLGFQHPARMLLCMNGCLTSWFHNFDTNKTVLVAIMHLVNMQHLST